MNTPLLVVVIVLAAVIAVAAIVALVASTCDHDINITCNENHDDNSGCGSNKEEASGTNEGWLADDTLAADDDDEESGGIVWGGIQLALETSNTLQMRLVVNGPYLTGTVRAGHGPGEDVIASTTLSAEGDLLSFPEAKYQIYTLKFQGPAVPEGPCGSDAISYALSLTRHEESAEVIGGIAVHCGDSLDGRPVRMLRLRGELN
jgi:hypothetical protein